MATLTTQVASLAGLTPAYGAANAGGDNFVPDVDTYLHVKNTNASPKTVVVATPHTDVGGLAITDVSVSVPATTGEKIIGPFPAEEFGDPNGTPKGNAFITYTPDATGVTIAVVQIPRPISGT